MLQLSKVLRGREEWKAKALQRADELREHRKAQARYRRRISELTLRIKQLEAAVSAPPPPKKRH
jgi:hypothetical protein